MKMQPWLERATAPGDAEGVGHTINSSCALSVGSRFVVLGRSLRLLPNVLIEQAQTRFLAKNSKTLFQESIACS